MKQRILSLVAFCLLLQIPTQAQYYRVMTDSTFEANIKALRRLPTPSYRICADSLIEYVSRNYESNRFSRTEYTQVSALISGCNEQLRQVTAHIIDKLLRLHCLEQYSEQIDDGKTLRGRYIAKLQPEGNDTTAYVLLKYDRNLLVLKQSSNDNLKLPQRTQEATAKQVDGTNWGANAEESLSLWRQLRNEFYGISIIENCNVQVKYMLRTYEPGGVGIYLTNPAPTAGSRMKFEMMHIDDKYTHQFRHFLEQMELAGKEEGTVNGLLHNTLPVIPDTCQYYYACHTFPDGRAEFIGVTHKDSITYLTRATSETPGLVVNPWGEYSWMTREELKAIWKDKYTQLGIWVFDTDTKKSLNTARLMTLDSEGQAIDSRPPQAFPFKRNYPLYRYMYTVPRRDYYKIKVEADGYETGYGEIWIKDDKDPEQIEIFLKPKTR